MRATAAARSWAAGRGEAAGAGAGAERGATDCLSAPAASSSRARSATTVSGRAASAADAPSATTSPVYLSFATDLRSTTTLVGRRLLPPQCPRPKVHPGSQREHHRRRPREWQPHTPPQPHRGLPVTRPERRGRAVAGGGEPEQLIGARDERPLFLQAVTAAGALCDMRLDVLGLDGRELAVEIRVQRAVIHVRHVHLSFPPRTPPPAGGARGRGSCRWRRAPAPSARRSRRTPVPNPPRGALRGRAV